MKRYVSYVVTCNTPNTVTKEQVQKATDEDPTLLTLTGCIHPGWIGPEAENLKAYKENISDYTSRNPVPLQTCTKFELRTTKEVKRYVSYVVTCNTPNAVTKEQVQKPH